MGDGKPALRALPALALWLVVGCSQSATPTSGPPAVTARPPATIALGPTAAAVATRLPAATPIATAEPTATRPEAAVRVAIPSLGLEAPVVDVGWQLVEEGGQVHGQWQTVAGAAGHLRGSADPGEAGNCVLAGHSSDEGGAVFRGLETLAAGDVVTVTTGGGALHEYVVTQVVKLEELGATLAEKQAHARWLDPTDVPSLTLVTCWPDWAYTHRIIVRATLRTP